MSPALLARDRAALYGLCADLLSRPVDRDRLGALENFYAPLIQLEPGLDAWIKSRDPDKLTKLSVEYSRLFLLPKGVSPHARSWFVSESGTTGDQIAALVHQTMDVLELKQTDRDGNLAFDHLGLLYGVASAALASDIPERIAIGEHFEQQMFQTWVKPFAKALIDQSQEPLYRALGELICELHAA